jgi:dTDP-glucose 4,6-dehydratase
MSRYVYVDGAAGFIGLHVVEALAKRGDYVYAVDAMTYAAKPQRLAELANLYAPRVHVRPVDVRTLTRLPDVDAVVHLAASTHVDNSLSEAKEFVDNNVGSTAHLLELVRAKSQHGMPHYVHFSTDEVYGSIATGSVTEEWSLSPSSPYAASKAAADMLVLAWAHTYGVPATILRPTNTYGIGQYPEKLIPKVIRCAQLGRAFPIHGDGTQTRCWLSAHDLAAAVLHVIDAKLLGVYNVGGNAEVSVAAVVNQIRSIWDTDNPPMAPERGYTRLACDDRYAVNDAKLRATGWNPTGNFWRDLPILVENERSSWHW